MGRELVGVAAGGALLDYGCGDGTFVALNHDLFRETLGADIDVDQVRDCATRLAGVPGVRFVSIEALHDASYDGRYDAVVCMEVLEHCPSDVQPQVLADLARLVRRDGIVVISVPIEIGPTLAIKQAVRAVAAATGLTEYAQRERYRVSEFVRMALATAATRIERPVTVAATGSGASVRYHGHKGFNWKTLQRLIESVLVIERRLYSPLPLSRAWLNSQVWFVCRKR